MGVYGCRSVDYEVLWNVIWDFVTNAHFINTLLLKNLQSDREEVQLHTLQTVHRCTVWCQRERGVTTEYITNPVMLQTVLSDREELKLHT